MLISETELIHGCSAFRALHPRERHHHDLYVEPHLLGLLWLMGKSFHAAIEGNFPFYRLIQRSRIQETNLLSMTLMVATSC